MGMFNEVFKACPECGHLSLMQISQIVLGFGGFNLENPESLAKELTEGEIIKLFENIGDNYFECPNCDHRFQLHEKSNDEKINLIKSFLE